MLNEEAKRLVMKHTSDELLQEAECVEEYDAWLHISLMGYGPDKLREMAEYRKSQEGKEWVSE